MRPHPHTLLGFSLIEVTLALGVAAFCLLSIFGLLPLGLNSNQNAAQQTSAAGIATAIAADLHGTPVVSSSTSRFQILIPDPGYSYATANIGSFGNKNGFYFQTLFFSADGSLCGAANSIATPAPTPPFPPIYRATISFTPEDAVPHTPVTPRNKVYKVWIWITWPALADHTVASPPVNFSGSFESVTTLNCN